MPDEIGAECERPLIDRCCDGVIHDDHSATIVRQFGATANIGETEQRVARRLEQHEASGLT